MTKPTNPLTIYPRVLLFGVFLLVLVGLPAAHAAKAVSQFGITWKFDRDYQTGQFANGDYWVVGPVTIVGITPQSKAVNGQVLHGSMINPIPNRGQAFDSRVRNHTFASAQNVARQMPLVVPVNSSLVSAESFAATATGNNSQLKQIAVLTVLPKAPPAGSFRPPYAGSDKTIRWNKSNLDYSRLKSLKPVSNTPDLAAVEGWFEKPLIELTSSWAGSYIHPAANSPSYGREISNQVGIGMLMLQLDYAQAKKEKLMVRLTQWGLDIYGAARNGMTWGNDGGHMHGRKPALIFAGAVLKDPAILAYGDAKQHFIFQEDQQTFYVSQADVSRARKTSDGRARSPYTSAMIGLPEWGGKHIGDPQGDAAQWTASYRKVCGASMVAPVLAARLMGLESKWNWSPLFDYIDRYYTTEAPSLPRNNKDIPHFVVAMWEAYRRLQPSNFDDDNVATEVWQSISIPPQTGSFTVAFDAVASRTNIDGVVGLATGNATRVEDLIAALRFAPSGRFEVLNGSNYDARRTLYYKAGVKYRIVATIDLNTKSYSVTVTPQGGQAVQIANGWRFRNVNVTAQQLKTLSFHSTGGYHAVLSAVVNPSATQLAQVSL